MMALGRVKCFFPHEGYGYIQHFDGRPVYFHYTSWSYGARVDQSIVGLDVDYDLLETSRGPEATNIRALSRV
ncbi:MAG: cold shock domain-containing protein [Bdellovibrionales bacterium]|nr:cold shock domain-containing protein [Bdellovibrionales bacterium]